MVGRLVVGFVRLNLLFSVARLATFSGVRVAQSLVLCLMVGRFLGQRNLKIEQHEPH
jgi:hypothetical protein